MSGTPSRDHLRTILDTLGDAVYTLDGQGRLRYCNTAAERVFGHPRAELIGTLGDDLVPAVAGTALDEAHTRARTEGRRIRVEDYLGAFDAWFEADLCPNGDLLTVFVRDVTARKRDELVARLRARVRAALERARGPLDGLHRVVKATRALTGIELAEVWVLDDATGHLHLMACDHDADDRLEAFARHSAETVLTSESAIAQSLRTAGSTTTLDLAATPAFERGAQAQRADLRAGLLLPVDLGGRAAAVVAFLTGGGPGHDDWFTILPSMQPLLSAAATRLRARQDLDRFFHLSRELLCVSNLEGNLERVNPEFVRVLGYSEHELTRSPVTDFIHPDDLASTAEEIAKAAAGAPTMAFENRLRTRDGSYRTLSWIAQPLPEEGLVYGAARDVTEERRQRDFEASQRDLLGAIALGEPLEDLLTRLVGVVESRYPDVHAAILLVEPESGTLSVAAAPTLPDDYREAIEDTPVGSDAGASGAAAHRGATVLCADIEQDPLWVGHLAEARDHGLRSCWAVPFSDRDGEVLGVLTVYGRHPGVPAREADLQALEDAARLAGIAVTRARTEQALRLSEERFRRVARVTADAVSDWDLETDELWWSDGYQTLFGHDPEDDAEAHGIEAWAAHIHPEDRAEVLADLRRAIEGDAERWAGEYRFRRADGSVAYVHDRAQIVRDATGQAVRMISGLTDQTERHELEQYYLRAQRMESIGTLAGGIAHDLNNVLTPILIAADVLGAAQPDERQRELIDMISRAARRGADMVSQVLTFARGADGERLLLRPADLVGDIARMARDSFPKGIAVRTHVDEQVHPVSGDMTQLQQVLLNLAVNARDAMPEGGTLTLGAENVDIDASYASMNPDARPGRYVQVTVADTGRGIAESDVDRIFEPFFTTKEVGSGTGLGLSTSLAIVQSHEGFMHVYSEPDRGTSFKVFLPALDRPSERIEHAPEELPEGAGQLVLVAEDEPAVLDATRQTLESFGYRVLGAVDGAQAVALFAQHLGEVEVVVTDMMMPVLDGVAATHAIRRLDPTIRVIASTGLRDDARAARAAEAGASHFLSKPYSSATLLHTLREVLAPDGPDPA